MCEKNITSNTFSIHRLSTIILVVIYQQNTYLGIKKKNLSVLEHLILASSIQANSLYTIIIYTGYRFFSHHVRTPV